MPDVVDTMIENRWIVHPNHANTLGTAHGGNDMKWMDKTGVLSAMRFAGRDCVTVEIDDDHEPVETPELTTSTDRGERLRTEARGDAGD